MAKGDIGGVAIIHIVNAVSIMLIDALSLLMFFPRLCLSEYTLDAPMEKNRVTSMSNVAVVEVVIVVNAPLLDKIGSSSAFSLGWWKFVNSEEPHPRATI